MDISLKAKRCLDYETILKIIQNDVIFDCISEDGVDSYIPNLLDEYWITLSDNGNIIGCFRIHQEGSICWQIHAFILPEHRKKYSKSAGIEIKKWMHENIENLKTVYCKIPSLYENVIRYVESMGFNKTGEIQDAFFKNGKAYSLCYFSLSKNSLRG